MSPINRWKTSASGNIPKALRCVICIILGFCYGLKNAGLSSSTLSGRPRLSLETFVPSSCQGDMHDHFMLFTPINLSNFQRSPPLMKMIFQTHRAHHTRCFHRFLVRCCNTFGERSDLQIYYPPFLMSNLDFFLYSQESEHNAAWRIPLKWAAQFFITSYKRNKKSHSIAINPNLFSPLSRLTTSYRLRNIV